MNRERSNTWIELMAGLPAMFEGVRLLPATGSTLERGDTYLAERNDGPELLTVASAGPRCVYPVESGYPYDTWECIKVEIDI